MNYLRVHITSFIIIHFIDEFVDVNNDSTGNYNGFYLLYDNENKVLPLLNVSQVVGRNQVTFQ